MKKTPHEKLIQLVRAYIDPSDLPQGTVPEMTNCGCEDGHNVLRARHGIAWFDGKWWRPDCLDEAFVERARELLDAIDAYEPNLCANCGGKGCVPTSRGPFGLVNYISCVDCGGTGEQ